MARDASYQPGVYRTHGGNVLTVSTTDGRLNIESGGRVVFNSGSYLDLKSGATISSSASLSTESLTIVSTGTLTNNGTISNNGTLGSTGTINAQTLNITNVGAMTLSTGGTFASSGTSNFKTLNITKTGTMTLSTGGIINSSGTANFKTVVFNTGGTVAHKGTLTSTGVINMTAGTIGLTGGTINSSGNTINFNGGTINLKTNLANTGTITNSSDGQIRESVETKGAAGALTPYGISVIGTTAGATAYTLVKPPAAGLRKTLICKQSTGALTVACSSLCTLNYGTSRKITFAANADGYALELIATSSTNWQSIRNSTAQVTTIVYGATA